MGGASVVAADLQQVEKEVQDVEIETHSNIDSVVEVGRDFACSPHVVADVESEETGRRIVHEADVLQVRDEQLEDANSEQAQECHEERTADVPIKLREHQARETHQTSDHGSKQGRPCHHTRLCKLVLSKYRPEDGAKGNHHHIEADERDDGVSAEAAEQDADDRQHEAGQEEAEQTRFPGCCCL